MDVDVAYVWMYVWSCVCVDVTFVFWLFDTGPFRLDPLRRLRK